MRLELVAMSMVEEFQAMLGERFSRFIENRRRFTAGLLIEIAFVRNPGATGVFQAQRMGLAGHALGIITITFIPVMGAYRFETALVQLLFELLRRQAINPGQFDILETEPLHF